MRTVFRIYYIILYPIIRLLYPFKVIGRENIPDAPMVICANHSSAIDPIILAFCLGFRHFPRFMAKAELGRTFLVGGILRAAGVFFVERGKSDITALKTAMGILRGGGELMMFPEGTRISEENAESAKNGAIMLSSKMGVPILPVHIPRSKKLFHHIDIVIGEPYSLPRIHGGSAAYAVHASELMHRIHELGVRARA